MNLVLDRSSSVAHRGGHRARTLLIGIVLALGCEAPVGESSGDVPIRSLDVESILWSGCTSVVDHGICEIGDEEFTLWIPGDDGEWHWELGGEEIEPDSGEDVDGGTRSEFELSFGSDLEGADLQLCDEKGEIYWSLRVRPDRLEPRLGAFKDQLAGITKNSPIASKLAIAKELLAGVESAEPAERLARIQRARMLSYHGADIETSSGRVERLLRRTVKAADGLGRWGEQCAAAAVGIFLATHRLDFESIEHWRKWEAPCRERSPRWQVGFDFHLGVVEMRQGHYEEAVLRLGRARKSAARLGLRYELPAQKDYVEALLRTARWAEAQRALEALENRTLEPCVRASLDADIGFFRVRARQQGDADLGDPSPVLERALALHDMGKPCENVTLRNHDLIKLGFAAALRGDEDELADRLAAIEVERLSGKYPGQYEELRARHALLRGDVVEAGEALEAMASASPIELEPESRWRRHMLRAQLAEREGEGAEAIAVYRDAEQVLDEMRQGVASGAVRERWLTSYRRSAVLLVERLIDADRIEEAACAARNARVRALASHDLLAATRSAAKTSPSSICERPWSRRADELVLLVVPRDRSGWWVFEVRDELVQDVISLSALPGEGSAIESWWDPWSASLQNVEQVRILASEAAFAVPFHRLGWQGAPLMSQRAVVYGLDLSTSLSEIDPATQGRAIVAFADVDPLRSLGRHAAEVAEVAVDLERKGWIFDTIEDELLDRSVLHSHLSSVELLHYYGHGTREAIEPGVESVEADDVGTTALLLGGGTTLGVEDVLSLSRVPKWVVLFGCRVGHADLRGWSGGLSLAHAFLLAGSRQVVASTEPLDARAAAALGPRLYEGQSPESIDLSHALRNIWSAHVLSGAEEPAWKDLRVWSR